MAPAPAVLSPTAKPTVADAATTAPTPEAPTDPHPDIEATPPKLRLPSGAHPVRYDVELTLSPDEENYTGHVAIQIELERPLSILWLNADSLTITHAEMTHDKGALPSEAADSNRPFGAAETVSQSCQVDPRADRPSRARSRCDETPLQLPIVSVAPRVVPGGEDFVGFAFDEPVGPGRATLSIDYSGLASAKESRGIFRRKEGPDWYLYTQFEEMGARRAFPCFDEPGFKVPWRIALDVPKDTVAVSNAPLANEPLTIRSSAKEGWRAFRFADTHPLPSYLVAFAVGPFEFAEGRPAGSKGVPFRVVTPRGQRAQAAYAVESTPEILSLLESYFGSPYPYDKLDVIAVPLFGGAMENPGLITFSRALLLAKPQEETIVRQRRYATVIAHELAHMWFGDLVTLAWWNDTWLNESFANWMESKIVEEWKPGWEVPLQRVRRRSRAMETDSLISARRVRQPIESKDDIANAFDAITYDKGSSVLAMFEGWIGEDTFRKGVRRYLSRHAWGSATADDFFDALSEDAGRDVAPAFKSFLDQGGFPLVTETLSCPAGSPPVLRLSQSRYFPAGSKGSAHETWKIPICIRHGAEGAEHHRCLLLEDESSEIPLDGSCPTWLVPNEGTAGYYRARILPDDRSLGSSRKTDHSSGRADGNVSPSSFDFTARLLTRGNTRLTPAERVGMLDDLTALVESGDLPAKDVLSLVPAVAQEGNRSSLEAAVRITKDLRPHLVPEALLPNYRRFVRRVFGSKARELGFRAKRGEPEDARLLRPAVVSLVAQWGEDPHLQNRARALASKWLRDPRALQEDMVDVVLAAAARYGDEALFERMHMAATRSTDRTERRHLLDAMAEFQEPRMVQKRLPLLLSDEFEVRDAMTLLRGTLDEPRTKEIVLEFMERNYSALADKLPKSSEARLAGVARGICDTAHRTEVESFFKDRTTRATGGPRVLAEILEGIDLCIAQTQGQQPSVAEFLEAY